ncbi:sensor histidine kinase [Microbacterium phyllosphaerae]|uniref:sensor histidine kinase n=1 Tax=Microbacterium phyllosphaerae TaxID=124798 RepID=UPI003D64B97C
MLVAQTLAFAALLATALVVALVFAGQENERGAVAMLDGGVADELAERVLSRDPRPIGRPFSLYAVVDVDGRVIATAGADRERLGSRHLTGLTDEPGARAAVGNSFPLEGGGWLVVVIDPDWRNGRIMGAAWPIALLIAAVGGPAFYVLRVVSVRSTRSAYRMGPEQVDQIVRERAALLESIDDAAIGIDRDGGLLWFNSTAGELLSVTDDEIGTNAEKLLLAASGGRGGRALDAHLIQIGDRVLTLSVDMDVSPAAGESRLVILRDYSRDAALLRALDGAQNHIDALRSRGHEFANTLHIIEGLLEMAEPDRALEFVRAGGVSGEFGMPADGIEDPSVRALVYAHRARAREGGISLVVAPGAALPDLAGADQSFTEASLLIVGNFLSNAIESCSSGDGVVLMITTAQASDGSGLVLTFAVDDSGPGVPAHLRDRVFSLGTSTKTGRESRGYGLAIVRGAVTRLGGDCECRTSELGGMQFEATLPIPDSERSRFIDE